MIEFPTRTIWVSEEAKNVWAPKIQRINNAWKWIEILKGNALITCDPKNLLEVGKFCLDHNLILSPLKKVALSDSYSVSEQKPGKEFAYRCAVAKNNTDARIIYDALLRSNDSLMGWILGFPDCCVKFFNEVWNKKGLRDTHFEMDFDGEESVWNGCNILLRSLGLRMVSHLPCSFSCINTSLIATNNEEIARRLGYQQEWEWLKMLLSFPIEYSALHGIARIKTPLFEVSTPTDYTDEEKVIQLQGTSYPIEGARGNSFPYRKEIMRQMPIDLYSQNGFKSPESMFEAHEVVLGVAKWGLNKSSNEIMDLGCGNGVFLQKIYDEYPHLRIFGVDLNAEAIRVAQQIIPRGLFTHCSIFDTDSYIYPGDNYSLTILMPGRILEGGRPDFIQTIKNCSRKVCLYAYGDWLTKYGSIEKLALDTGFISADWKNLYGHTKPGIAGAILLEAR